jgi:putative restriction endonuclease
MPDDWKGNIVSGKTYDTLSSVGGRLWREVQERLIAGVGVENSLVAEEAPSARYGQPHLVHPRLGQGAFRIAVSDAYQKRCAVTAERTLPALAASHIQPYSKLGPHQICNGIMLRSDLHNLFDLGYITVTTDYRLEVSSRIKKEFENGRHYYAMQGQNLSILPTDRGHRPDAAYLEWHHNNCYRG